MSVYQQLVDVSQQQLEAFQAGNVRGMQRLILERQSLIAQLPPPSDAERALLQQAVGLGQSLATAVRERMLALRTAAAQVHQRRTSLNGYRVSGASAPRLLDFVL